MIEESSLGNAYPFPVVGVGASAGGMDAFKKFVSAIPQDSGMAFILLQHFDPERKSVLHEILQKVTLSPVLELDTQSDLSPGKIYVLPPDKMMVASEGKLKLENRPPRSKAIQTIDRLFSVLAEVGQNNSIGVVLSGMNGDGTAGLIAIKDQGGLTFAQLPSSAAFPDMPQHAEDAGAADFIMLPELIPGKILELSRSIKQLTEDGEFKNDDKSTEDGFRQILTMIRVRLGVDFSFYKQSTIRRRIVRRMVILRYIHISEYLSFIKLNISELDTLFNDLLIPVTSFFRDTSTYEQLTEFIFPEILKDKSSADTVRIWVAGCSTGQEPYSIAISLQEFLGPQAGHIRVQIFASDISDKAIKKARSGIYSKKELEGVSEQRLEQYFNKLDGHYQVIKEIRDMCVFATHNLLKDPPFARMDLITCRNVLIYFQPVLQKKAMTIFHYALNERKFLWLGKSETAVQSEGLFSAFKSNDKFYIRKSAVSRLNSVIFQDKDKSPVQPTSSVKAKERKAEDYQKIAEDILLSKYTPAGVIVNEQFDIIQFRGNTTDYLGPSPGKASLNVFKMAKEGLAFELRNALHKARKTKLPITKGPIFLFREDKQLTIEAIPLTGAVEPHYLILFIEGNKLPKDVPSIIGAPVSRKRKMDEKMLRIQQLEQELAQSRAEMRTLTEEQESANEELQSTNEELLSGSEELQSLNEELETSREEVQSTNEELVTVNQELYESNLELEINRKFAEATLTILHEPLIVIDKHLKVTTANNAFYKIFQIEEINTLNKSLFQLHEGAWDTPELKEAIEKISLGGEKMIEKEIVFNFKGTGERIIVFNLQPLNRPNGEKLFMFALNDVTLLREKNLREQVRAVVNAQEDERRRISEILHNELGQLLSMAKLGLPADQKSSADLLNQAIIKVRNISYELLPPVLEEFGLEVAVKDTLGQQMADQHIDFTTVISGLKKRLDPVMEITAYRIIQELLNNVIKHAQANRVELKITRIANNLNIRCADNGSGIQDVEQLKNNKGFGLKYIRGRVTLLMGQINILSEKAKGAKVIIDIPL